MVKALFITLNIAGLALLPFLYVGNVEVEHTAPSEIEAGGEIEVEITLNKGSITGPARLKLDFADAEGLTAEDIDNAGASFTFTGDNSLYIWYSIQPDEVIKLKYKLKAADGISGTKTISGSFSYLDESERKKKDIPSIIIEVTGGAVAANTSESGNSTSTTEKETVSEEINVGNKATETSGSVIDNITCSRTVEQDGDDFVVTIDIVKGTGNGGFARVKEVIPSGFTASEMDSEGAVFKNVDNYVKFLWTSLPRDKENVTLKYRLIPETAADGDYQVNGEFSGEFLIVDDVPQKVKIPTSYLTVSGQPVASNENSSESGSSPEETGGSEAEGSQSEGSTAQTGSESEAIQSGGNSQSNGNESEGEETGNSSEEEVAQSGSGSSNGGSSFQQEQEQEQEQEAGTSTSVNTPNTTGVRYKVQVLAAHKTVSSRYIKKRYGYSGKIALENHEGWVKYTTGKYNVYKDARDKRESLGSFDFPGPFVTAYNSGDRITVQEALMITKQDWVQ